MTRARLPKDSVRYAHAAFEAKDRWHRAASRMSLASKLRALDRMRESAKRLPRVAGASKKQTQSR